MPTMKGQRGNLSYIVIYKSKYINPFILFKIDGMIGQGSHLKLYTPQGELIRD